MKYRARTTFQHNGGLYVAGADVPVTGQLAGVLVRLGRIDGYEDRAVEAEDPKPGKQKKRAYKRRDMQAED